MKIQKKKFVMGPDPNAGGSAIVKKEPNPAMNLLNPSFISAGRNQENPGVSPLGGRMERDASKNSLNMNREGSAQRLVEDK
jgi:hypothetical protein